MDIFHTVFFIPIFNILILLYRLFSENLGLALIGVALLSRIVTIPITNNQIKASEKNKEFQEKYNTLKKKFGKNKEKFNQEAAKLQAEYLPGQIGGCLPMIVQLVMFIQIFNVLNALFQKGHQAFNEVAWSFVPKFPDDYQINFNFLNLVDLGKSPANIADQGISEHLGEFIPYLVLLLLVVLTQYFSTKVLTGQNKKKEDSTKDAEKEKKKKKKATEEPDMADIMQSTGSQMQLIFPVLIGFFTYNASAGLALYWTVQSTFVIIQGLFKNRKSIGDKLKTIFSKK